MLICKICGAEKPTKRSMNMHLIRYHDDEYQKSGRNMLKFVDGAPENVPPTPRKKKSDPEKKKETAAAPAGFRLLNRNLEDEARAYEAGFRYIDDIENIYDADEAKKKGWI